MEESDPDVHPMWRGDILILKNDQHNEGVFTTMEEADVSLCDELLRAAICTGTL